MYRYVAQTDLTEYSNEAVAGTGETKGDNGDSGTAFKGIPSGRVLRPGDWLAVFPTVEHISRLLQRINEFRIQKT